MGQNFIVRGTELFCWIALGKHVFLPSPLRSERAAGGGFGLRERPPVCRWGHIMYL